ncbi:hypothetical protein IEO21_05958 [Rhodonia placenta]|uniref:Uncharacterized protein n=1 Tax=Rhodonia placenta TaxID=104341 RepID=A0A8H7P167_9APHY|nr:hypothetical protein IEO21_05958 [Postia placenta]
MAESSSAKEVVMATQEVVETIELMSQSSEQYDDEQDSAPPFQQLACILMMSAVLIVVLATAIPRLPRRKQTPSEVLRPLFAELGSVVSHTASDAMPSDHRKLITSTVRTVSILNRWMASESSHDSSEHDNVVDVLYSLLTTVVEACANNIDSHLAQQAFQRQFPRLVVPFSDGDSSTQSEDITRELQTAIADLHLTPSRLQAEPTLGSLILLAHTPSYTFTTSLLTAFFAVILMALQTNHALDEVLALLIYTIVPFRAHSPASDFPPDLLIPLAHILSSLASVHPDSATRHHTFRLLASILALAPSPLRLQLLHELLTDEDTAPQMRVAAIGLVKDALLEALAAPAGSEESSRNVFASHLLLRTLGPILLHPHPPSLFDTANQLDQQDFLDTAEPLRLVECLALCYVWLLRDVQNRTGLRDADNLRNVEHTLLEPLRRQLRTWDNGMDGSILLGGLM